MKNNRENNTKLYIEENVCGQKYRLKVDKTKPTNASKEVIWTSSNEKVATISVKGLVCKSVKNVRWISSNKSVETVSDKGVVTAKKAGTVVITASDKGNRNVTMKCMIKIEEKTSLNSNSSNESSSSNGSQNSIFRARNAKDAWYESQAYLKMHDIIQNYQKHRLQWYDCLYQKYVNTFFYGIMQT